MKDALDGLKIPYKMFGFDSSMSGVVNYANNIDDWMENKGGKAAVAKAMGVDSASDTAA